ncbi:YihY/virulence factor BrkB family protein [Sphingomonas sp. ASV193]|uniref:YihY/virulence factor BrkB family protein n=1 Tax=Sphingomonas sp. ASV193 TaxID=3144405 RepID=UPI0032E931F6
MKDYHPQSPEARRRRLAALHARFGPDAVELVRQRGTNAWEIARRVLTGTYDDGFIHAGNLAYISLVAMFPFIIVTAALAKIIGRSEDAQLTVIALLSRLPPQVSAALSGPIDEMLQARTGPLLWFGAIVGLWTTASFIETIRDILRRAYGVRYCSPFWEYRLLSIGLIVGLVVLLLFAFAATVLLTSVQHYITAALPFSSGLGHRLGLYRLVPAITLYITFYAIFLALTPQRYRTLECRKWPGALLVTGWWLVTVELLPLAIGMFGGYALTYGSLAGVMVALIFFWIIGLGVVMGAELNAALADAGDTALEGENYKGPYRGEVPTTEAAPDEVVKKEGIAA